MKTSYKVIILGAGGAGISIAARLARRMEEGSIALVDKARTHYYQPAWTLVGGGIGKKEETARAQKNCIPKGVDWLPQNARSIEADRKQVTLEDGTALTYDFLVVSAGLRLSWESIEGSVSALGKNGVCSIYEYEQVDKAATMIQSFSGGRAIFIMPPTPIKCAGAPQKIMYLAEEIFRKNGVREKSQVIFAAAGPSIFGIPTFAEALTRVVRRKNIETLFQHKLLAIDGLNKIARFEKIEGEKREIVELKYDLLHVVPPMTAPDLIKNSGLCIADGPLAGWLKVDPATLQHRDYPEIFGAGDVTGIPNSKTAAAVRKQAPVVAKNLLAAMEKVKLPSQYDGYSSCPLVTERGKVILAEFGYDGKLLPTFPVNPAKERWSMWLLKRYFLQPLYWRGMLKGWL